MRRVDGLDSLARGLPAPVVSVGTFDGVHLGHRRVVDALVLRARELRGTAVVVTFEEPPRSVLEDRHPLLVASLPHRLRLLDALGVDVAIVLDFTRELAAMTAEEFLRRVLVEGIGARVVVLGHGSAFGRNREGDEAFLRARAPGLGIEVLSVPAAIVDGARVSSTRVREAVLAGDFALAERLLGRPASVFGTVVPGDGRGREMGFPTANLDLHHELMPPDGVYLAEAQLEAENSTRYHFLRPALVSIGTRPTFSRDRGGGDSPRQVEVHLIDFSGNLYGRDVEARFLKFLRPQERFADVDALRRRMNDDLRAARDFFATR